MGEARRFLRYVIPGLALMIEVSFYLLLSSHQKFVLLIKALGTDIAFPTSVFVASGGVGFLLGVLYHIFGWFLRRIKWTKLFGGNDHLTLIKGVVERGWLKLLKYGDDEGVNIESLTELDARNIVYSFLWERKESSPRIRGAYPDIEVAIDMMSCFGEAVVGSIIAIPIWIYAQIKYGVGWDWSCSTIVLLVSLLMVWAHIMAFNGKVRIRRGVVGIIVANQLQEESKDGKEPITMSVILCPKQNTNC